MDLFLVKGTLRLVGGGYVSDYQPWHATPTGSGLVATACSSGLMARVLASLYYNTFTET
jgi:hypothetical protein